MVCTLESFTSFLQTHAPHAHLWIFLALLLGGCNIPISIDVLVVLAAFLAVHYVPEHTYLLYGTLLVGCILSAWIAYAIGRGLNKLICNSSKRSSSFILSFDRKKQKMLQFYQKYGVFTFLIGRFIPFGVRNCLFMTSGFSQMPFTRFVLFDALACTIWLTTLFTLSLQLGTHLDRIQQLMRSWNLSIFVTFSIVVIAWICYKYAKKKRTAQGHKTPHCNP